MQILINRKNCWEREDKKGCNDQNLNKISRNKKQIG